MDPPKGYFNRNQPRSRFRPRAERMGDRQFGRDFAYWQRQMGQPQRNFPRFYFGTRQQRARNNSWITRQEFHRLYGADADWSGYLEARKYRPEDLADPVTFQNILYGRKEYFGERDVEYMHPDDVLQAHRDEEEIMHGYEPTEEDQFVFREEDAQSRREALWRRERMSSHLKRYRTRPREATPDLEDLPTVQIGKKVKFEDAE